MFSAFFVFGQQPPFDFLDVFGGRQAFRANAAFRQCVTHSLVVGDVFFGDVPFAVHFMLASGDLRAVYLSAFEAQGLVVAQPDPVT